MPVEDLLAAVTGPVGAIVVLAVAVVMLAKAQVVVPGKMFAASEERNKLLEREANEQQQLLFSQSEQLTEQRVHSAKLEQQVAYLTEQVQRLTAEIEGLRAQLRQ